MELQDILSALPRGKEDKPLLLPIDDLTFDPWDIDGRHFEQSPEASGCVVLMFSKNMDPNIPGKAYLDGMEVHKCALRSMPAMMGLWVVGISLRGYATEPGRTYLLRVEGFADTDGNVMQPTEYPVRVPQMPKPEGKYAEHENVALCAATEGIVLLKNENALPLPGGSYVNFFGSLGRFRTAAAGAGNVNPRYRVGIRQAVEADDRFCLNRELADWYSHDDMPIPDVAMLSRAREKSDTAIMLIDRSARESRDNHSGKGGFLLADAEEELLNALHRHFSKLIVILNVGHPIDVTFAERYAVDAVLYNGFGGMLAGQALWDVLCGDKNPSGKLPDTWAMNYQDIPSSRNFYDCADKPLLNGDAPVYVDTVYEEGIYVGYRYFSTFDVKPAYPFGFGLSYTDFAVTTKDISFEGKLLMTLSVTNTGSLPGKEAPQVYIRKPETLCETPERELCWFQKTKLLMPSEKQIFDVEIDPMELAVFDTQRAAYVMPAGEYLVFAGNSSQAPLIGSFMLEETIVKQASHLMLPVDAPTELTRTAEKSFPTGKRSGVKQEKAFTPAGIRRTFDVSFPNDQVDRFLTFTDLQKDPSLLNAFVNQLSVEELAQLSICAGTGWGEGGCGEAGRFARLKDRKFPDFRVSDGNSGLNLRTPNIGFPSGATMAATFDPALLEEIGRVLAEEAKEQNIPLILAPGMNTHRNPLCGRQPEYFSEDPYLSGTLGGHYCRGMEKAGVASCVKHLIANNCETSRKRNQSILSERTLREIYMRIFEVALRIHKPASAMTSYNAVNGIHTATDEELIQGFLRRENGFDGFVMTDWDSYQTMDVADAVNAGNSWITPGGENSSQVHTLVEGVAAGKIRLGRLRENVAYIVKIMLRFGI